MARKSSKVPELGSKGLVFEVDGEMPYLAILDVASYTNDLPDWEFDTITKKITAEMNAGHIVAWGCPEVGLSIRITDQPLRKPELAKQDASISALLSTEGLLCLAGYSSLTMCAQFSDEKFPQIIDHAFRVKPGTYRVDVHRLFAHRSGDDSPKEELEDGEYVYVVALSPATKAFEPTRQRWVPWATRG